MEQYDKVTAIVKIRRDCGWKVRSDAEEIDGKEFDFIAAWPIERGIYKGEWAMMPTEAFTLGWIASGDLCLR